jgi:hypothetical protein
MIASGIGAFEALVSQGPARLWLRSLPLGGPWPFEALSTPQSFFRSSTMILA